MVKNLKELRLKKGISQQQLADVIGVSQQSINKYENHKIEPDINTLCLIANYFETSVDYLVGNTEISRKIEITSEYSLSESEKKLITSFRKLNPNERICVVQTIGLFLEK